MSESYGVSILPVDYEQLREEDVSHILERALRGFPMTETDLHIPEWLEILPPAHWFKTQVIQAVRSIIQKVTHTKGIPRELE